MSGRTSVAGMQAVHFPATASGGADTAATGASPQTPVDEPAPPSGTAPTQIAREDPCPCPSVLPPSHFSRWCSTRTSLTEKCQDIADGIEKMDALERAADHEFETSVRGASGAERQQPLCALRGVRRLAADRAQVVAAGLQARAAWPGPLKPT